MYNVRKRMTLAFILGLVILCQAAIDIYLPSLPQMAHHFGASVDQAQMTVSIYLFGFGGSQIFYGPLADRFGRMPVLLFGLPLFVISSFGIVWAPTINFILLFRFFQGAAVGAASVCARAIMRDVFTSEELPVVSSYMSMGWAFVPILAPTLGGIIQQHFGWKYSFILLGLLGLILTGWLVICVGETGRNRSTGLSLTRVTKEYCGLFKESEFKKNLLLLVLLYSVFSCVNVAGPVIFQQQYNVSAIQYGWIMLVVASGYFVGSFLNSRLLLRMYPVRIIGMGAFLLFIAALGGLLIELSGWATVSTLMCSLFVAYLALGLIFANAISASLRPFSKQAGIASSMYGVILFCSGAVVSAGYALFFESCSTNLAYALCLISGLMLFSYWFFFSKKIRRDKCRHFLSRSA
ncbi:multidrug effflux MFS transporter [Maridesulfovibrio sp.]|jgi:Bcr/CflA subfamily drug resistance transporter|uniref:multidrug effflux MFS transporter n=1 Tax=Maridesulfovibrio sp. TaxID=2795000 RepID=UPI0029C9FB0A|nr:multidrug effflux MFS transporter [Maridesulfovibrio sp.]